MMRHTQMLFKFMGLGSFYGLLAGPLLGLIYYLVVFQFSLLPIILYFIALGILCGSLLGGINGLILGIVTVIIHRKSPNNNKDARRYKIALLPFSIIATFVSSYLLFNAVQAIYSVVNDVERLNPTILLAILLAIGGSVHESLFIGNWYLNQAEKP